MLLTLGFAWRTHQRMEVQIATDTAAYSQAISTCSDLRTPFPAHQPGADQPTRWPSPASRSLISYSGVYRANLDAAKWALVHHLGAVRRVLCRGGVRLRDGCACAEPGVMLGMDPWQALTNAENQAQSTWDSLDPDAAKEAKAIRDAAGLLMDVQEFTYISLMTQVLLGSSLSRTVVQHADSDLQVPMGSEWKSMQEVSSAVKDPQDKTSLGDIAAVMGSRGSTFVTARDWAFGGVLLWRHQSAPGRSARTASPAPFRGVVVRALARTVQQSQTNAGDIGTPGGLGRGPRQCPGGPLGSQRRMFPLAGHLGCQRVSRVRATSDDGTNEHTYGGTEDSDPTIHAMGSCPEGTSPCMWPKFMDYNQDQVADQKQLFRPAHPVRAGLPRT